MEGKEADTVVMLSSELISRITEEYFNKTMFKQKVEIVDSKPTDTGYMFSITFVSKDKKVESIPQWELDTLVKQAVNGMRDSKGKFTSTKVKG